MSYDYGTLEPYPEVKALFMGWLGQRAACLCHRAILGGGVPCWKWTCADGMCLAHLALLPHTVQQSQWASRRQYQQVEACLERVEQFLNHQPPRGDYWSSPEAQEIYKSQEAFDHYVNLLHEEFVPQGYEPFFPFLQISDNPDYSKTNALALPWMVDLGTMIYHAVQPNLGIARLGVKLAAKVGYRLSKKVPERSDVRSLDYADIYQEAHWFTFLEELNAYDILSREKERKLRKALGLLQREEYENPAEYYAAKADKGEVNPTNVEGGPQKSDQVATGSKSSTGGPTPQEGVAETDKSHAEDESGSHTNSSAEEELDKLVLDVVFSRHKLPTPPLLDATDLSALVDEQLDSLRSDLAKYKSSGIKTEAPKAKPGPRVSQVQQAIDKQISEHWETYKKNAYKKRRELAQAIKEAHKTKDPRDDRQQDLVDLAKIINEDINLEADDIDNLVDYVERACDRHRKRAKSTSA